MNTPFLTFSPTFTLLLSEIHVDLTTLLDIHFQYVLSTWILSNKKIIVREYVKKSVHNISLMTSMNSLNNVSYLIF